MSFETKSLVGKKRVGVPFAIAGAAVLGAGLFAVTGGVHAASYAGAMPLDDRSVNALTSLDSAMEAVTSRVTPAVVNVAVTSRGSEESQARMQQQQGGGDDGEGMQGMPPGFEQFFGGGGQGFGGQGGMRGMRPQQPGLEHGIGSGIIISPDGYIVTNNHVVDGAVDVKVTLNDRRVLNAKVVGVDKLTDLAVLKVNATGLPSIAWGDSTQLHPGQTVLAFGSPFGSLQFSVTRGIISALGRPGPSTDDPRKPGNYIQTDAAINPGNSGGALVDAHGELVGINTFIISGSGSFAGAGFAIPSQIVRATAEQLIAHGKVEHGYMGISLNDVTPANASFFNLKDATGTIVAQVTPDSPASRAGLKQGDVVVSVNGRAVNNSSALQVAVSEMQPGAHVALGVLRNGAPQTVNVALGEFHNGQQVAANEGGDGAQGGKLGVGIGDLTQDARQQLQIPANVNGVLIGSVRPGSPAEDAGLQQGDVVVEVNRQPAGSAAQFSQTVHADASGKDLLLLVWSKGGVRYLTVRPEVANG